MEVLKSFGTLQLELEQARTNLKDVDEHIKKLIGRDPSENQRLGQKRPGNDEPRGRARNNFQNNRNEEPPGKKRNLDSSVSVFKRLDKVRHFDDEISENLGKNQLISKVIVTPKELPSRQDILKAQGTDEKSKARNRRMFGALLGTLHKFRQEETKLKPKEEKRAQVEKKLEEQEIKEREEMKKERQDLFFNRKRKQAEIRMIELKITRMKEHSEWEEKQKPLMNFIQTKAKPQIYFLPKILNDKNKELLETNKTNIEKMIDRKRQDVYEELNTIEQRMNRNFSKNQTPNENNSKVNELGEPEDVEMVEIKPEIELIKKENDELVPETVEDITQTTEEVVEKIIEETVAETVANLETVEETTDNQVMNEQEVVKSEEQEIKDTSQDDVQD